MIKLITNKTKCTDNKNNKIEVESLLYIYESGGYTSRVDSQYPLYYIEGKQDVLFIKITFEELKHIENLTDLKVILPFENQFKAKLKVYKQNHADIYKSGDILNKNGIGNDFITSIYIDSYENTEKNVTLDLSRLAKDISHQNNSFMIAIKFECDTNECAKFYKPSYLYFDLKIDFVYAAICNKTGLNSFFTYDTNSIEQSGDVNVNLCNGEAIYSVNAISTSSRRMPITFCVYHNPHKVNKTKHFDFNLTPNFYYEIEKKDEYIDIIDPTGGIVTYVKAKDESERNEIFAKYDIKPIDEYQAFYFCYEDYSYIFTINEGPNDLFELHYRNTQIITFKNSKIDRITNSLGHFIQFYWNGDKLNKIENIDGDIMTFSYSLDGKIQLITVPKMSKYCYFTSGADSIVIKEKNEPDVMSIDEVTDDVQRTKLNFSNGKLMSVYDYISCRYMLLTYQDDKVKNIAICDSSKTKFFYKTSYSFNNSKTTIGDMDGNRLNYYFDSFGAVRTILDNSGRSITRNYEKYDSRSSERIKGISKVQYNIMPPLDNQNFERGIRISQSGNSWQASSGANAQIVDNGLGGRCLKFVGNVLRRVSVQQSLRITKFDTIRVSGLIKHENLTEDELKKIHIGLSGSYEIKDTATGLTTTKKVNVSDFAELRNNDNEWYEFTAITYLSSLVTTASLSATIELDHLNTTVYIDNFRIEEDNCIVRNNLIENGYMQYSNNNKPTSWELTNSNSLDGIVSINDCEDIDLILAKKAYRFAPINFSSNRKIYQTIDLQGSSGDEITLNLFAKSKQLTNMDFDAYIRTTYEDNTSDTKYFNFQYDTEDWQVLTGSVIMKQNYKSIEVGVYYYGQAEAFIGAFQLYKDSYGTYFNYDDKGNLSSIAYENGTISRISYDDDNMISERYSQDGSYYKYNYDFDGRLIKVSDLYNNALEFSYNDYDEIKEQRLVLSNGEIITNSKTFDPETNNETYIDELGHSTEIVKDKYGRVTQQKIANMYNDTYKYNLQSQLVEYNRNTKSNKLTYTTNHLISSMIAPNGSNYNLQYDYFGNLTKVSLYSKTLQTNTYSATNSMGYSKQLLLSTQYGFSGDIYKFEYNDKGLLKKVKIGNTVLCENQYDEYGNIIRKKDNLDDNITHYKYDSNGNLITKLDENGNTIRYTYDNLGNVQKAAYKVNKNKYCVDYQYDYETNDYTKEGYFNILSTVYGDDLIIGNGDGRYGTKVESSGRFLVDDNDFGYKLSYFCFEGQYMRYDLSTTNNSRTGLFGKPKLSYENWSNRFKTNKTFSIWMKPSNYADQPIFTFENELGVKYASLNMAIDGRIYYNSTNSGSQYSTAKLNANEWNFVYVNISDTNSETKCRLTINGENTIDITIQEKACNINYLVILESKKITSLKLLKAGLYMALLSIGTYDYSFLEIYAVHSEGRKYLIDNNIPKASSTIYSKAYRDMDIITLNGSYESINGLKPESISIVNSSGDFSKSRSFCYDKETNKLVFGSYDSTYSLLDLKSNLSYKLNLVDTGTVSLRLKLDSEFKINVDKPLFYFTKENRNIFGLYICPSNYLRVDINGVKHHSGINIPFDEWHSVGVVFSKNKVDLVVDGVYTFTINDGVDLEDTITYIGSNPLQSNSVTNGLLEMFAFTKTAFSVNELCDICKNSAPTIVRNNLDAIGRLSSSEIHSDGNEFIIDYTYNKTQIRKETDSNGDSIEYEYNDVGKVVKKEYLSETNPSNTSTETYGYDNMGRLSWEIGTDGICQSYTYDDNGNILNWHREDCDHTVYADKIFTYDSQIKDRLMSIDDGEGCYIVFSYDDSNPYLPNGMIDGPGRYDLIWQGKRLIKRECINGGDDSFYEYYANGLRKSKSTYNTNTKYYYEGSNLIQMIKSVNNTEYGLDFVYDANGMLIGINSSQGQYFYRRDITGNIKGILDSNGNYVVKYKYDAWGNVLDKQVLVDCIVSNHNPFLYKGYVYDEETKWYYLQSRYYIPEIGRFLSPDSIDYADPETIGGLNLYAYCNNDPINYCDPSGHSALLIGLIIGAIIGACVGFGAAAYIDYKDDGEVFNGSIKWYDYLFATMFGTNFGGAIGAGLGVFAGTSFSISIPMLGISASGGAAAISVAGTVAVTVTGAQILTGAAVVGGIVLFRKQSKKTGKEMASDVPSWVNKDMVDFNLSPKQNAKNIMDSRYGKNQWKVGPGSEYNRILKWIVRKIFELFGKK